MAWRPRKLRWLLAAYAAVLGYALVAWAPALLEQYDRLAEAHPNWAYAYLGVVATGGALLAGASFALFWRMWRNSQVKEGRRASRLRDPSQLSPAERQRELADNLASSQDLADDEETSQALRDQLKAQLLALEAKQTEQRLEIVAFGTISSGKSTLLNALAGREAFASDVIGGTTAQRCEIAWPGADRVTLVDTPGLAEIRGEGRAALAADAAQNADLVLLVVDGPLKSFEVELAERLLDMEKRLLVCLNKLDWYNVSDARELLAQIAEQLPRVRAADVVAVRAGVTLRERVRVLADGRQEREQVEEPPDVSALTQRMLAVLRRDGSDLLLANLLIQSRSLVDDAKLEVRKHLDRRADEIISRYMWAAGGAAGVNPFPLLDIAGSSAITLKMVLDLARVYRQPLDADLAVKMLEQLTKNLIAIVGSVAATPAIVSVIASMVKTVPGVGTLAGGLVQGIVQALVTRWIGNVFVEYLRNEMQPPPGGLTEVARRQWRELTRPEALRKLIHVGREHFAVDRKDRDSE